MSRGGIASLGGATVTTKGGKNRDQYGRKFGKKQQEAMLEFTKTLWLQDSITSLKNILQIPAAQNAFMAFLKTEYSEAQLEFFLEAQKLETLDPQSQNASAVKVYQNFVSVGGKGIGQQDRTSATQQLWDNVNNNNSANYIDPQTAMMKVREEAETTLKMLAFDAFPRFIKSPMCAQAMDGIKQSGNGAQIEGMLSQVGSKSPQDADDWLNIFVSTAESFPA
eukprot:gene16375-21706_t